MSLLEGINTADNAEKETDRLGGFQLLDANVHLMKIKTAYLSTAASEARAVMFEFESEKGVLRSAQYFCSGKTKGKKTYYIKNDKQFNLPGFIIVNDIFRAVGFKGGLDDAVLEEKFIKLYNHDAGGEVVTPVQMVTNLIGKEVALGVRKQTVDKTALGSDNKTYEPTGETRDVNELDKVFTAEGLTQPEIDAGITEPTFIIGWKEKYEGKLEMLAKGATGGNGTAGAPAATQAKAKKLFK